MDRGAVTTWLDLVGLVLVAAGVGAAVWLVIGWSAVAVSGVVLLVGSRVAVWNSEPARAPRWWARWAQREAGRR